MYTSVVETAICFAAEYQTDKEDYGAPVADAKVNAAKATQHNGLCCSNYVT